MDSALRDLTDGLRGAQVEVQQLNKSISALSGSLQRIDYALFALQRSATEMQNSIESLRAENAVIKEQIHESASKIELYLADLKKHDSRRREPRVQTSPRELASPVCDHQTRTLERFQNSTTGMSAQDLLKS